MAAITSAKRIVTRGWLMTLKPRNLRPRISWREPLGPARYWPDSYDVSGILGGLN